MAASCMHCKYSTIGNCSHPLAVRFDRKFGYIAPRLEEVIEICDKNRWFKKPLSLRILHFIFGPVPDFSDRKRITTSKPEGAAKPVPKK